jgi:hypothetical protein
MEGRQKRKNIHRLDDDQSPRFPRMRHVGAPMACACPSAVAQLLDVASGTEASVTAVEV